MDGLRETRGLGPDQGSSSRDSHNNGGNLSSQRSGGTLSSERSGGQGRRRRLSRSMRFWICVTEACATAGPPQTRRSSL